MMRQVPHLAVAQSDVQLGAVRRLRQRGDGGAARPVLVDRPQTERRAIASGDAAKRFRAIHGVDAGHSGPRERARVCRA